MVLRIETPDPIDIEVGLRIRQRRRWLGRSQTQLAKAVGITFQQIQKYERGTNRVSASMLVKIAAKLETSVAALVGEEEGVTAEAAIYKHLADPEAVRLLRFYAAIADGNSRRAFMALAEALAAAEDKTVPGVPADCRVTR